jgi:putative ABC transport system permease protein
MKKRNPPRWVVAIFRWFCNDHLSDAVLGDLLELYDRRRATTGKFKADLFFILNVVQFIQPFALRRRSGRSSLNTSDMLRNYFTIAWRNMSRHKMYTAITIGGFALGLATCMVIFLFIREEVSFDEHYKAQDRIFRLYHNFDEPGNTDKWTNMQTPLAGVLKQELPEIENIARLIPHGIAEGAISLIRREDQVENIFEKRFAYVDPDMLRILEIPMIYGDLDALDRPATVVISKNKAIQLFGDIDPVGKTLIINDDKSKVYTVSGVMEDFRKDSHFQFDFLFTLKDYEFWPGEQTDWCCWNYSIYLKLREGVNVAEFEQKMLPIRDNYIITYFRKMGNRSADDYARFHSFKLQPIADIYLQPEVNDSSRHGDLKYTWMFGGIAVVILMLACINFINLSTAKSANRAKEVGLRKVVGSLRKSLVTQFLSESVMYSLLSFVIALGIVCLTLPTFNFIAGRELSVPWTAWWLFPLLITAALIIGIVAGVYPAFYLSSFRPISVLKGNLVKGSKGSGLRSAMVVFQFTASIVLMTGTFVIYRQMNYIMVHDVGFDREHVMVLEGTSGLGDRKEVFKNELLELSGVDRVSVSSYLPVDGGSTEGYAWFLEGRETIDKSVGAQKWRVDPDYISTMRMKLVEGRDFNPTMVSDSKAMIVNRTMVRALGLKEPIGARVTNGTVYTIIGVVEDFNFWSLREPIFPLGFVMQRGGDGATSIRINSDDLHTTIESVEGVWNRFFPNQPFRYSFLDQRFAAMYDDVLRTGRIFALFAGLAIVVACLGLLALSAFVSEQRKKEISIRRVMGASVNNIFRLLTGNFMKLVFISWLLGTPLAWYAMNQWLQEFSFREPISSDVLIASGVIVSAIALTTVAYQTLKAATANPVENLRQN